MKTTCFKLSLLMLTWNFLYRKPRHGLQKSMSYSDMGSLYVPTFWNALKDHIRHLCQPSSFHKQLPLWLWCSRHQIFSHHSCLFHSHFFFFFFSRIFTWSQLGWETDLSWSWLCLCALTWVITKLKAQGVCFKPLPLRKLNHLFKVQQQTFGLVLTLSHIKFNNF